MTNEKEITNFILSIRLMAEFCREADIIKLPEITIVFTSDRDKAYFEAMIKQKVPLEYIAARNYFGQDLEIYGIKIKCRLKVGNKFEIIRQ